MELAAELPKATRSLQEVSPELAGVVGVLDNRFAQLDTVVTELAGLMQAAVGNLPGFRSDSRSTSSRPTEPR